MKIFTRIIDVCVNCPNYINYGQCYINNMINFLDCDPNEEIDIKCPLQDIKDK